MRFSYFTWPRVAATVALASLAACNAIFGIQDLSDETSDGGTKGEAGAFDATVADGGVPPGNGDGGSNAGDGAVPPVTDTGAPADAPSDATDSRAPPPPLFCDGGCAAGTVCAFGACVAGNCETTADCADAGTICVNSVCTPCSQDYQCTEAYPGAGLTCLSSICSKVNCNIQGRTCAPDHICCLPSNTTATLTCLAGECCSVGNSDPSCVNNHTVTSGCPLVTSDGGPLTYYVNPDGGTDVGASGAASCPFQTITHALAFVGTPSAPTVISVLGATAPEAAPLAIPQNVTVEGPPGTPVNLALAPPPDGGTTSQYSIVLAYPSSGVAYLSYPTSLAAVGAVDRSTVVHHMAASDYIINSVYVAASSPYGGLTLGPGFNGNFAVLKVSSGSVRVLSGTGDDATNFEPVHDIGIYVTGWGSIDLEGDPDGGGAQLVANGVVIHQAPSTAPYPNTITAINCETGFSGASGRFAPGVQIYGGSSLTLRNSTLNGNQGAGVELLPGTDGTDASFYAEAVDLGTASSPGRNSITGNCGANLWLSFVPATPLPAEGNVFAGGDCLTTTPALADGVPLCILGLNPSATNYDVGVPALDGGGLAKGAVDVKGCTLQ